MTKWILLAVGTLLLIPAAWHLIFEPMRPTDSDVACRSLIYIPASQFRQHSAITFTFTSPNDAAWKRIRHSWGDPSFAIVHASGNSLAGETQHCFDPFDVRVRQGRRDVPLEEAGGIYLFTSDYGGYPDRCKSIGKIFRVAPGSTVQIGVEIRKEQLISDTELIIWPYWPDMKDKLVGLSLDRDLPVERWAALVGLVLMLLVGLLLLREKYARNMPSSRGNISA